MLFLLLWQHIFTCIINNDIKIYILLYCRDPSDSDVSSEDLAGGEEEQIGDLPTFASRDRAAEKEDFHRYYVRTAFWSVHCVHIYYLL